MCTALTLKTHDFYFGRTLDLDCSYGETVCILPRNMPLSFRKMPPISSHYAIIGMGTVMGDTPLFYDGANEHGLAMAGLNFPENACYLPEDTRRDNITPFELIPYILGSSRNVTEARAQLKICNIVDIPFNRQTPNSPLHWMIADSTEAIVAEQTADGLHIYDNPAGVMTNNPPFPYQLFNLNNYRNLKTDNGTTPFSEALGLREYCQGLGGLGLPGDLSSMSRFVRAVFGRENSVSNPDENSSVNQFFRLLGSVSMNRGMCKAPSGHFDITVYTSCINTDKGLYYYTTYDNLQICCVDMHKAELDGRTPVCFPLKKDGICYQN